MFKIKNGIYCFNHKRTGVEWTASSLWSALAIYAASHGISLTEAVMLYERQ